MLFAPRESGRRGDEVLTSRIEEPSAQQYVGISVNMDPRTSMCAAAWWSNTICVRASLRAVLQVCRCRWPHRQLTPRPSGMAFSCTDPFSLILVRYVFLYIQLDSFESDRVNELAPRDASNSKPSGSPSWRAAGYSICWLDFVLLIFTRTRRSPSSRDRVHDADGSPGAWLRRRTGSPPTTPDASSLRRR